MHSVISHECTGCGLCVEPCPVDCIEMVTQPEPTYNPTMARERFNTKQVRLLRNEQDKQQLYREKRRLAEPTSNQQNDKQAKQNFILQALARAQEKNWAKKNLKLTSKQLGYLTVKQPTL